MPVGVLATAHQSLRFHTRKRSFDPLPIDSPASRQPPLADTIDGISSVGVAVQVTQERVYHLGKEWLRFQRASLAETTRKRKQ